MWDSTLLHSLVPIISKCLPDMVFLDLFIIKLFCAYLVDTPCNIGCNELWGF